MEPKAKKSLGQHWLTDTQSLEAIVEAAQIKATDSVLEIGPGLGHLTELLTQQAAHVIAVELDEQLAVQLPNRVSAQNLTVINQDILSFNLGDLPSSYKVVANIPYYLTSNLIRSLAESSNPPARMVLLVQKEVAERVCAKPGQMNLLAIAAQLYYNCNLGPIVPADKFSPPPKVDSRVVALARHPKPIFDSIDSVKFWKLAKAGFSERRKKLRSSLAGGLGTSPAQIDKLLARAGIDANLRAQNLSLQDWHKLSQNI